MDRAIKTILVSLNHPEFLESAMRMAGNLAERYDSHIIGLYVIPSVIVYTASRGLSHPSNYVELNQFYSKKSKAVEAQFNDYVKTHALNAQWRSVTSAGHIISEEIINHGRETDLIILGDDSALSTEVQFQGRIIKDSGRPVLIVPHNTDFSGITPDAVFKKTIIAWDGSREASRAAFDSLPLLKVSTTNEVTTLNAHKERELSGDLAGSELAAALARHDVIVDVVNDTTRKPVSKALMDKARGADLLVMGAYGHSRLLEDIFGGATKAALKSMPCPVLLSN